MSFCGIISPMSLVILYFGKKPFSWAFHTEMSDLCYFRKSRWLASQFVGDESSTSAIFFVILDSLFCDVVMFQLQIFKEMFTDQTY